MNLEIIYEGTEKEKELMKNCIKPFPNFPRNSSSLDNIVLGTDEFATNKVNTPEKQIKLVASPLFVEGEYVTFAGMQGRLHKIKDGKYLLENSRDVAEFLQKSSPFVISLKPQEGKLDYHGNNLGGVKLTTWKSNEESVYFSLKHSRKLLQAKLFYSSD